MGNFRDNGVPFYKLSELVEFRNGKGHEKNIVNDGKYIVVNSKFISTDGEVKKYSDKQISPVYRDDILMVMSDLPNGRALAKCFLVNEDDRYTLNQRIGAFKVKRQDIINIKYLYYYLNRNMQLLKYDNGVDQTNLRKDDILNIKVAVPPLEAQCEIVHVLDDFTLLSAELSAELKARQKQYDYYKQKIFDDIETDNIKHITDIALVKARVGWQRLTKAEYLPTGDYYLITGTDFTSDGNINFESCVYVTKDRYDMDTNIQVHKDDILITKDGTLGKVAILKDEPSKETTLNSGVFRIKVLDENEVYPKYLYHFFTSKYFKDFVESVKTGSTIPHLTQQGLVTLNIPIPSLEEQIRLTMLLDSFDKLTNDISEGLPAEIEARQKQYEFYRDKLLSFKELKEE